MRLVPRLRLLAIAIGLALVIWLASDMPFWGAGLIAVFAVIANVIVARVEDDEPGGFNNPDPAPPSGRIRSGIFRVLGFLLGAGFVATGVLIFLDTTSEVGWWRAYVAPVCIVASGAFFAYYAVTGRSRLSGNQNGAAK
jgi:hypothetical protein